MSKNLLRLKNLEVLTRNNSRNLIKNPVTSKEQYECKHKWRYNRTYHEYRNNRPIGVNLRGIRFYIESYCVKCRCLVSRLTL